ncbi:MAG: ABC transporter ATP-binding protein [Rickettsiales bacterium]|nr:ABC transporter ATP-binding protein [Rickettsiales bacterium]
MDNIVLGLKDVNKSFLQANQKVEVIKAANFAIKKGEIVALIGPSGSGKTTILQIAGLLDSPDFGTISINGIDVSKASDQLRTETRKNHIGFIYQAHHLFAEFSALENVTLPLLIQGKNKEESIAQAKKILKEVELEDRLDHKPSQLSGGQQQRVALARALVTKPSLILADEPTGNLDTEISTKVFEILQNLVKSYNIACLVVTHNLDLAKKSDRILAIKNGLIDSN